MKVAIMQPTFLPWLGYFDLIDQVDFFVLLDDVQLSKQSWQVRNRIKCNNDDFFLSIPYIKEKSFKEQYLNNTQINYSFNWQIKHLKTLSQYYSKARFYSEIIDDFTKEYLKNHLTISDFNISLINYFSKLLNIEVKFVKSSALKLETGKTKTDRLVNICEFLKTTTYISPVGSKDYLILEDGYSKFESKNINLTFHDYNPVKYNQIGNEFVPCLSIIDALFTIGPAETIKIIRLGRT